MSKENPPTATGPESFSNTGLQSSEALTRGPRVRMRKVLLTTAMQMMADGITPSLTELAEAAEVSRATAYRYFPTQSDLIAAVVDESLGPILSWESPSKDAAARIDELITYAYPRLEQFEVQLRAAIQISLQQGAQERASKLKNEHPLVRGHRVELLKHAIAPLRESVSDRLFLKTTRALSMIYGTEVFLVLKDIWHLEIDEIIDIVRWTASAIMKHAVDESAAAKPSKKSPRKA